MTSFPTTLEAIDAAFLGRVLGREVVAVSAVPLGEGRGGFVARLEVACADGARLALVAKVRAPGRTHPAHVRQELHFYRRVADRLGRSVPRAWFAEGTGDGDLLLLLEHVPGRHPAEGLDAAGAYAALRALARIHGACWGDGTLRAGLTERRYGREEVARLVVGVEEGWDAVGARFPRHLARAPDLRDLPEVAAALPAVTLTHNDLHAGNVLVAPGRLVFVDWQNATWSSPMLDVANVLAGCVRPDVQRDRWRALLGSYQAALIAAGGPRLPDLEAGFAAGVGLLFGWVTRYLVGVSDEEAASRAMLLVHWERVCAGVALTRGTRG